MLRGGPVGCMLRRAGCHSPCGVVLAENVEQEGLHVVVQGFVIQEQLGQQAKVLAVQFGLGTIHLQPGNGLMRCSRDTTMILQHVRTSWLTAQQQAGQHLRPFRAGLQLTSNMTRVGTAAASEWLVRGSGEREISAPGGCLTCRGSMAWPTTHFNFLINCTSSDAGSPPTAELFEGAGGLITVQLAVPHS